MNAAMAVGAVAGGLITAGLGRTGVRFAVLAAAGFGVTMTLAALAPNLALGLGPWRWRAGQRDIQFDRQLDSSTQLHAVHERPGHGPLVGGIPGGQRRSEARSSACSSTTATPGWA